MSSVNSSGAIAVTTQAEYNLVLPTYNDGDATSLQADANGRLITIDQNSAAALTALQAIETATEAIQAAVADLDGNTDGIEALLTTISAAVADLDPNTDGIEALLTTISAAVADLDPNTDGLEALLTAIDAKLDTLDSVDFATQTTLAALATDIEDVKDTVNSAITAAHPVLDVRAVLFAVNPGGTYGNIERTNGGNLKVAIEEFDTSLPAGSNAIGSVVVSNLPATLGQKTMANSAAVVLASDHGAIPVTSTPSYLSVVDQLDSAVGPVLNAASNTIQDNAGVFLQGVASLAAAVKKIRVADTTGEFIGVYTGASSSEVLAFIINPGMDDVIEHSIASGTRISLRSMGTTDITTGQLCLQFLG